MQKRPIVKQTTSTYHEFHQFQLADPPRSQRLQAPVSSRTLSTMHSFDDEVKIYGGVYRAVNNTYYSITLLRAPSISQL